MSWPLHAVLPEGTPQASIHQVACGVCGSPLAAVRCAPCSCCVQVAHSNGSCDVHMFPQRGHAEKSGRGRPDEPVVKLTVPPSRLREMFLYRKGQKVQVQQVISGNRCRLPNMSETPGSGPRGDWPQTPNAQPLPKGCIRTPTTITPTPHPRFHSGKK